MKKQIALFSALLFVAFAIGMLFPVSPQGSAVAALCNPGRCYVNHAVPGPCGKFEPWREVWSHHLSNNPNACCGTYLGYECEPESEPIDPGGGES